MKNAPQNSPSVTVAHEASEVEPQLLRVVEEGDEAVPPYPVHGEVSRELCEIFIGHFGEGLLRFGESAVGHLRMLPPFLIGLGIVFQDRTHRSFRGKESRAEASGGHGVGHARSIADKECVPFDDLGHPSEGDGPCATY